MFHSLIPLLIALLASPPAPTPAASAARPTTRAAASAPTARSLDRLLEQALVALDASEDKAARDSFLDALSLDAKNAAALHGAGLAYLHLNDTRRAVPLLERAARRTQPITM